MKKDRSFVAIKCKEKILAEKKIVRLKYNLSNKNIPTFGQILAEKKIVRLKYNLSNKNIPTFGQILAEEKMRV